MRGNLSVFSMIKANRRMLYLSAAICILAVLVIIKTGYNYHIALIEEIASKEELYFTNSSMLVRGDEMSKSLKAYEQRVSGLESGLLATDKPSIGAAMLVELFKIFSSHRGISITSEKVLPFKDAEIYVRIPVEFQFKAEMYQLKELLFDLESSSILAGVRDLRIKAANMKSSGGLDVSMVVEGAIKR